MKAGSTHIDRAALKIRALLVTSRNSCANQLRGMLKLFGLRMGGAGQGSGEAKHRWKASGGMVTTPAKRAERLDALFTQRPDLRPIFTSLIESIEALEVQIARSGRLLATRAGADPVCQQLMSAPGVPA